MVREEEEWKNAICAFLARFLWRLAYYLILDDAAELIVRLQCLMQLIDLLLVHLLVLVRDVRRVKEVEEGVGRLLDLEGAHLCEGRWRERERAGMAQAQSV